tara:strand:+ start:58024 stop:58653 length:630 start_codon:yes stop_codon:yes gene_type:complete
MKNSLFPNLQSYIEGLNISTISEERKGILQGLIEYIISTKKAEKNINLNFICTHNSRRSHLGQIWAQTMASFFEMENVYCYSGGTEATALYPQVTKTLKSVGFTLEKLCTDSNPVYAIKSGNNLQPNICFSKKYDHYFNPSSDFAAALTCSQADQDCPIIFGASARIPLDYLDPKEFDNTDLIAEKYLERSEQIATEMYFVFSEVKNNE